MNVNVKPLYFHKQVPSKYTVHVFIYTKSKNIVKRLYIYNQDTLQKARPFPLRFYIQKARYFTLRDFHENFEIGIYIQKS